MATEVRNEPESQRYAILVDGELAGELQYRASDDEIALTGTEVDPAHQGEGLGSILVRAALDDIRATTQARVVPVCPYVVRWIEKHPDYADLATR